MDGRRKRFSQLGQFSREDFQYQAVKIASQVRHNAHHHPRRHPLPEADVEVEDGSKAFGEEAEDFEDDDIPDRWQEGEESDGGVSEVSWKNPYAEVGKFRRAVEADHASMILNSATAPGAEVARESGAGGGADTEVESHQERFPALEFLDLPTPDDEEQSAGDHDDRSREPRAGRAVEVGVAEDDAVVFEEGVDDYELDWGRERSSGGEEEEEDHQHMDEKDHARGFSMADLVRLEHTRAAGGGAKQRPLSRRLPRRERLLKTDAARKARVEALLLERDGEKETRRTTFESTREKPEQDDGEANERSAEIARLKAELGLPPLEVEDEARGRGWSAGAEKAGGSGGITGGRGGEKGDISDSESCSHDAGVWAGATGTGGRGGDDRDSKAEDAGAPIPLDEDFGKSDVDADEEEEDESHDGAEETGGDEDPYFGKSDVEEEQDVEGEVEEDPYLGKSEVEVAEEAAEKVVEAGELGAPEASEQQSQQMNENVSYVSKQHVEPRPPETEVATTDFPALFYPEPSSSDTVPVQQSVNVSHGAKQPDENESDSAQPSAPPGTQGAARADHEPKFTTTSRRLQRALALEKKREEAHARMLSEKRELSDHFESDEDSNCSAVLDEEDAEQFESSPDQVKWLSSHIMGSANSSRQPSTSRQPLLLGPATPVDECVVSAGGRRRNSLRKSGPTKTGEKVLFPRPLDSLRLDDAPLDPPGTRVNVRPEQVWGEREVRKLLERKQRKWSRKLHTIEESSLVDRSCSEVKVGMVEKCREFPDQLEVGTQWQPFRLPRFDSAAVELGRLTHTFRSWYGPPFLFLVAVAFFAAFAVWRCLRNLKRLAARCDSICLRSIEEHCLTLAEEGEPHSKTEKSGGEEFSRHYVGALLQALRFGEVEGSAAWTAAVPRAWTTATVKSYADDRLEKLELCVCGRSSAILIPI
eukprot:g7738.t1